ncbi:glutathione S-transferase family protein [Croceicoccus pelagius]|uniref:Glutathione S-transferase n=1 Tax=Croceicoccus pelagius TaxID=1703341 RepID=A0A916Y7N4_9SPHN|nr:glutathione S-transferase family protein [Croceicoccus pelagius]GGD33722.1 glutathione S-transferase [Croceicoccus pelagius]
MPQVPESSLVITAYGWVPKFARGFVRDLRPRWFCEEAGVDYSVRLISAMKRPDWYFGEQPFGQVPYVHDGDVGLFESGAILLHLAEKYGCLLPNEGQARADALAWLFAAFNSVEPIVFQLSAVNGFSAGEEWAKLRKPSLEESANQRFDRLASGMEGREWLAGEFSIADIAMATTLREADNNGMVSPRPVLADYLERALARHAWKAALDAQLNDFDDSFAPQKEGA